MASAFMSPANGGFPVTKSDSTVLAPTRYVYIGGVGDIKVTYFDSTVDTLKAVPTGTMLPISVTKVWSTGTTATNISALY